MVIYRSFPSGETAIHRRAKFLPSCFLLGSPLQRLVYPGFYPQRNSKNTSFWQRERNS